MTPPNSSSNRVTAWMRKARAHDIGLYRHSLHVADLTALFSAHLGYSPEDQRSLVQAALLHDIGKTEIPFEVLGKPGALTEDEIQQIRLHPETGYRLLTEEGGHSSVTLSVVLQHHERLDGTGYPYSILAPAISEPVRIVTLCDVYAAMTEPRPYATSYSREEAIRRMEAKRTRLDLDLLRHFAFMLRRFVYVSQEPHAINLRAWLEG